MRINYRHIIDWLVRKPGAFERYLYRESLFPTSYFRMTYDHLVSVTPGRAVKEYLAILELAAKVSETKVNASLRELLTQERRVTAAEIAERISCGGDPSPAVDVHIAPINLELYNELLSFEG